MTTVLFDGAVLTQERASGSITLASSDGSELKNGVVFVDTFPNADGISKAHTVIHTKQGDVACSEQAIFDLTPGSDHAFVDLCLISGGTGKYAGASGYIQEAGTFDFAANLGEADYQGKLILP